MSDKINKLIHKKVWLIAIMAALLYLPLLMEYFSVLGRQDFYKLYPVLLLIIGVIFISRWRKAPPQEGRYAPPWVMLILLASSLLLMLFALLYYIPWLVAVASILLMAVVALYLSSFRKIENIWGLWLLFILFLRPPYQLMIRIMVWMENMTSKTASLILDYGSVLHSVQGGVLALPHYDFEINAICSGWVSLVSTVATAAVICVARSRALLHSIVLLTLSVFSAWVLNVARFLIVVVVKLKYDIDLVSDVYLVFYNLFSLMTGLALVLCADALAAFIFSNISGTQFESETTNRSRGWLTRLWNNLCVFPISSIFSRFSSAKMGQLRGIPFILLTVVLFGLLIFEAVIIYHRPITLVQNMVSEDQLSNISKTDVVFERPSWIIVNYKKEKRDFANIWGALSNTWQLKYNGATVIMSLDYPFDKWHDVKRCYSNIGWNIADEKIADKLPLYEWRASETDMILPNGDYGFILCSHCDHQGNTVEPKPTSHKFSMLRYRLHPDKWTAPFGKSMDKNKRTYYQTQCMVATPVPLDEATKEEIRIMYALFREQTRKAIERRSKQIQIK